MDSEKYFKQLSPECKSLSIIEDFLPNANWHWVPWMTVCHNFSDEIKNRVIKTDPFLSNIKEKWPNSELALYNIPANTIYHWHRDADISFSINMVLRDYKATTVFEVERPNKVQPMSKVIELIYEPKKWYAFNSQENHYVANLDSVDRILLTVYFPKARFVIYKRFIEWYNENYEPSTLE